MRQIKLLILLPAIIVAGEVDIKLLHNSGKSTYSVIEPKNNLKATLDFPIKFYSTSIEYKQRLKNYNITIGTSFLLKDSRSLGEDFDWQNESLTVYSNSENKVNNFYDIYVSVERSLFDNFSIIGGFKHSKLDFDWYNTDSTNYVNNTKTFINGKTLSFNQKINQINIGIKYKNRFNAISLSLIPSLVLSNIENKDTHILRNFYTKQNTNLFGFNIKSNLSYIINEKSSLGFFVEYEKLNETSTDMKYYTSTLGNYQTLDSSFEVEHKKFGLQYGYKF